MEKVGNSSLWEIKYRPQTVKDLIIPDNIKNLLLQYVEEGDIPNIILSSTAGRGKTSTAYALCKDVGVDILYINGSDETSVEDVRYKIKQFAMTSSFSDAGKVCIVDECERLSANAQDALKALIEQAESNCRFIMTTNTQAKIIEPLMSRCRLIDYNFNKKEMKNLIISYFKRMCWILDQEKVKYDKAVVAELVQQLYPDFRKTLNRMQNFSKMHGAITPEIFSSLDDAVFSDIIEEMKNKKFNNIRKLLCDIDTAGFYQKFYDDLDDLIIDQTKPNAVMILGRYAYESSLSVAPEISLCACITELMKEVQFK